MSKIVKQSDVMKEAHRCIIICNACRYCEGFCALFPAMELRRTFTDEEMKYFANLCHNCRGCYYACQYAPPHEFDLNFPQVMQQLRKETWEEFAWPSCLGKLYRDNGLFVFLASLVSVVLFTLVSLGVRGREVFFGAHSTMKDGAKDLAAFYKIIPEWLMIVLFTVVLLAGIFCLYKGVAAMWRITKGKKEIMCNKEANKEAIGYVLKLRYLDGGGDGCNYPDDRFGFSRKYFHHAVFYGFLMCFAATGIAFIYDHMFGWHAPYSAFSLPKFLGTVGGLAVCIGTGGMVWLKCIMDKRPYDEGSGGMDVSFTVLIFLIALSGLMLQLFRSTSLMGLLLCTHLGLVMGFFLSLPFGKFVHVVYRYAALVRHAYEQKEGKAS